MASFAIIQIGNKQYKAHEGDALLVDKLAQSEGEIKLEQIVLINEDGKVKVGNPFINGAQITASVLGEEKGEKIEIMKFRAKSRYRRHTGFRAQFTRLKIEKLLQSTPAKRAQKRS